MKQVLRYKNPLFACAGSGVQAQPDPYMIRHDGTFYVFATNPEGVAAYSSQNLQDWEYCGIIFSVPGRKMYWAPSVIEADGTFYMYWSDMPQEESDVHTQRIAAASADSPLGPYTFRGALTQPFSIDPHVVRGALGEWFMFYSVNKLDAPRRGTCIVADRMLDPLTMAGQPKTMLVPTLDEEIFERDRFKKGEHWHTLEGAFYFYDNGVHYLMYSGSAYTNENYFIGYAISREKETDLTKLHFQKMPDDNTFAPILCSNELVEGMGHNSVIKIGDKYYIVYHGRDRNAGGKSASENGDYRTFRMDELKADDGKLSCTPTTTPQTLSL